MTVEEAKQAITDINNHAEGDTWGTLADAIEALIDAKLAEFTPPTETASMTGEVETSSKKSTKKSKSDD